MVTPNPSQPGASVHSSGPQHSEPLSPYVWTRCLDSLGSDGYELVSVTPLGGDVRVENMYAVDRYRQQQGPPTSQALDGKHDVQLWVFKRERPDGIVLKNEPEEDD